MVPYYYNNFIEPKTLERKDLFFHGNIAGVAMAIVIAVQPSSSFFRRFFFSIRYFRAYPCSNINKGVNE